MRWAGRTICRYGVGSVARMTDAKLLTASAVNEVPTHCPRLRDEIVRPAPIIRGARYQRPTDSRREADSVRSPDSRGWAGCFVAQAWAMSAQAHAPPTAVRSPH